jgi:hypothetical protein
MLSRFKAFLFILILCVVNLMLLDSKLYVFNTLSRGIWGLEIWLKDFNWLETER